MSNPTPILNNINAFDATQGTTISFNIIGGTDIVRSNIVYIYDLSTNDLICTHLYISTESIHELPPNTDPSIVYADGKSSADFVNNKNYYLQIQTFTNTAGTAGGSGMSVAKTFWCLFNPALSVNAIPAAISTTSYNVGATYTTNVTDVTIPVTNIIQQYKFDLYTATGTLVQTSGNIIGSGEQEGTSTTYNITYNFSGLVVNNSYYVVVTTTSTQGMNVSTQSNTFTVSIETPTLGEATVVNNACDGYISVTSNLSGEYGGSASGEIATFVTDSVNDVSSLKVTLTPQQDGTPWIGTTHDTTPYLNRAMPTQSNDYNRESGVIVGGTVGWNQLAEIVGYQSPLNGVTFTVNSDGSVTVNGTASGNARWSGYIAPAITGHVYYSQGCPSGGSDSTYRLYSSYVGASLDRGSGRVVKHNGSNYPDARAEIFISDGYTANNLVFKPQYFDLTAMFGSTIADYIYSLEQATAGAGVAWFRKYFPEDYYPYSANTLQSVQATAHKTYDADDNVIGNYALDSSLTLRGIPKLDASNNLYYDGDTYASDGTVTRKRYRLVLDGTVTIGQLTSRDITVRVFYGTANLPVPMKTTTTSSIINIVSDYPVLRPDYVYNNDVEGVSENVHSVSSGLWVGINKSKLSVETVAGVNAYLAQHPITVEYELATPATETAQAYTNPQIVDPDGTEEYVTANSVPVGHDSTYSLACPISGYDSVSANVTGINVWDEEWELGSISNANGMNVNNNTAIRSTNFIPVNPSTAYFFKSPSTIGLRLYGKDKEYINSTVQTNLVYTIPSDVYYVRFTLPNVTTYNNDISINYPSTDTEYHSGTNNATYTADLGQTVYGGTVDLVSGVLTVNRLVITRNTADMNNNEEYPGWKDVVFNEYFGNGRNVLVNEPLSIGESYGVNTVAAIGAIWLPIGTYGKTQSEWIVLAQDIQITIPLATPQTYQLTPQEIRTLLGVNNVWSDSGDVEITYNIPITNLLVKRQDVADVSGTWLTLYSQSVTQASDMDFTFIDFLNQHGKTYRYALVPLLTQQQGDVDVEIEGGYTVSDDVLSVFDGVFIANGNGSQKLKAATEYGDLETNQDVGVLTTIGGKYPFVVSNSNLNYHSGSISALIVPSDFYTDGDLDRLDIVERREAIEQFLTDKTAKILKDWNGNIWLITFVENVEVSFVDDYGMGLGTLSAKWVEIGDVNDQTDLQQTGLI